MPNEYWLKYIASATTDGPGSSRLIVLLDGLGWRILDEEEAQQLRLGLAKRYAPKALLPVIRRDDSDDVVCLLPVGVGRDKMSVELIHDFADPGWEVRGAWAAVPDWINHIVETAR